MSLDIEYKLMPLSARLKQGTSAEHSRLDKRIMKLSPFADRQRFSRFVRMQVRLHAVTENLYNSSELQSLLPSLAKGDRLAKVLADSQDLGVSEVELAQDIFAAKAVPKASKLGALGWVYTQEGSSMGGAILFKIAKEKLGLSEEFGARHLAGHAEGRARYWRKVTGDLDAIQLDDIQMQEVIAGAIDAFNFVYQSVDELYKDLDSKAAC
ncbi:biliverdin-producing heme oxygenase [Zhongshania marina]|nr:biliverdin-producing heme oxygenase [Marortus luteolus]